jgi:hypothetical protein
LTPQLRRFKEVSLLIMLMQLGSMGAPAQLFLDVYEASPRQMGSQLLLAPVPHNLAPVPHNLAPVPHNRARGGTY